MLISQNPGVSPGYSNFLSGWSYCGKTINEPVVTIGPTKTTPINNRDAFDFMEKGMSYSNVLSKNGITLKQLAAWDPSVKDNCSGHDKGGTTLKPTTTTTSKTSPTNGVETPSPAQPDIVKDYNNFDFVQKGQNCDALAKAN
ncbi:hypothetical protein NOF04DRAFT_22404 [Fusarium oxysporum II5]|uniref:LysM domain-containing protein n=2 Tax=Fusarium oxysporum f. sp. cubense (strain race 4) TaxID=2502994 RepID=X0IMU6_FUSO5|nr:uncharacterized protein FOIG_16545 [Fusarium odoratissimum NRRL 54006]EXL90187.1 hypothetical protein FOIG_16545 [Fusarium odoratissimum NRRL 54006]KAK2138011.1 hypothetical protein NOF04DRAFT_22404 [Fusarium oxysporum II5]